MTTVERKMLAIPAHATGQITRTRKEVGRHRMLHRPIVGQRESAPTRVIKTRLSGRRVVECRPIENGCGTLLVG